MTGPIDRRIGTFGEFFRQTETAPGQSTTALTGWVEVVDGPLTRGLGLAHNEMSWNGCVFADRMRQGMTDTGDILVQVSAEYENIDQTSADSIRRLFAPPPGGPAGTAPEGAR